jgi:prepilin-type processing-associated H-X9-DG protein
MPFLEKLALYESLDRTIAPWAEPPNNSALRVNAGETHKYQEQICPSDPFAATGELLNSNNYIKGDGGGSGHATETWGGRCYDVCLGPQCAPTRPADCPSANSYCNVSGNWWYPNNLQNGVKPTGFEVQATPGIFNPQFDVKMTFQNITDGLSSTFLLLERRPELSNWSSMYASTFQGVLTSIKPNSPSIDETTTSGLGIRTTNNGASSLHVGGIINTAMADGSVASITDNIDFEVYNYLGNRMDGNSAKLP